MGLHPKRCGQPPQGSNRRVSLPPLKIADVAALHAGFVRQLFLSHAPQLPVAPNIFAEKLNHIHPTDVTATASNRLYTNRVIFTCVCSSSWRTIPLATGD